MILPKSLLFLLLLAATAVATAADGPASDRGRIDYILHCSGCHALDGSGVSNKGIPAVKGQIGYYLQLPEGRAFIMQVPGLLAAGMSDERAAGVVNWMVEYFAGPSMPAEFMPYTAEEAKRYRLSKPADVIGTRRAIAAKLNAAGYPLK